MKNNEKSLSIVISPLDFALKFTPNLSYSISKSVNCNERSIHYMERIFVH